VILSTGDELEVRQNLINPPNQLNLKDSSSARMEDIERGHILNVLNQTDWKIHGKKGAAQVLDVNPSTLRSMMVKLGIKKKIIALNQ